MAAMKEKRVEANSNESKSDGERKELRCKKERTEHDLNSVEWGPSQISIFLLSLVAGRIKKQDQVGRGEKGERQRKRVEERGMGNNFTWSNWLRFIIYDLGNNPLRDGKERETAGRGVASGAAVEGKYRIRGWGGWEGGRRSRARRGGKSICE